MFGSYDAKALRRAIDQAMHFHRLDPTRKRRHVRRIMTEAAARFSHAVTAQRYFELYEQMLERPLLVR